MPVSIPSFLNAQTPKLLSPSLPFSFSHSQQSHHTLKFLSKPRSFAPSLQSSYPVQNGFHLDDDDDDPHVIGDCLVFEEGIFEDPYLNDNSSSKNSSVAGTTLSRSKKKKAVVDEIKVENLVPENWREVQAEININKKQRRKIAQEMEFNSRLERRKRGLAPIRSVNMEEYQSYKEAKLAQLKPLVLDNPVSFKEDEGKEEEQGEDEEEEEEEEEEEDEEENMKVSERVAPKNPRWAVYGRGLDDVTEFFNSASYEPGEKKTEGRRKLFTKEEKVLLNKKIPDLAVATSNKWLPLHTLAASGEFYLMDALLKHNVDINAMDVDGLTALHKAVICRKQAITSYLLRESADPFARDMDGASLMHYAVQTASTTAIKHLLLYNVDINLQDNDGWTPLHLAVQGRRTDMVKLLLIKGADKTLKNHDGLTPLDVCLYSGRDTRTYELIKLLKQLPKKLTALRKLPY